MASGHGQLTLKPINAYFSKQYRSDEIAKGSMEKYQKIEDGSRPPHSNSSPQPVSKNANGDQKKKGNKKKSGKGGGDAFRIHGNTINGGKADKVGVFGFGNKYMGRKKQKQEESSEEDESDSDEDEE